MCDCCFCCLLFSGRHHPCVRYKCDRQETPDILFFGDSSMDYLKYTLPRGPCTGETRAGWKALKKRLRPLRVDNMAMVGASSYELCCAGPSFLCLPCTRPKRAIVMSMGGNDFLWLPFVFNDFRWLPTTFDDFNYFQRFCCVFFILLFTVA